MNIEVKEWDSLDKKGHPRAQIFQRLVHGGDIITLPDTLVVHEIDSDIEKVPEMKKDEKTGEDKPTGKMVPKKDKVVTHPAVQVSANPNADRVDMSEWEHRMHTIRTSPLAKRWSKQDKELFLKYYWYTPDWMKPAPRGAVATIDPEQSMPSKWGRDIPNVAPGQATSVGTADTGEYVGKLGKMTQKEAIENVNRTTDANVLQQWTEDEKSGQNREKVLGVLEAQLRTATVPKS